MKKIVSGILCLTLMLIPITGCKTNDPLDPNDPVTLTMWHVFGSMTSSPMNDMVEEFNRTVGKERGVIINVESISNSSDIHEALIAAANGDPGAGIMPDLFFCYPETAGAIGADKLINWEDALTATERAGYVGAFLDEGKIDGKLLVFPVAKSSEALFVNSFIFDRFAAETGVKYDDLATWEGLFNVAAKYYDWSGGKSFVMHDELLNLCQINTKALGGHAFSGDKINFADPTFKAQWEMLAEAAISGHLLVEDDYGTVRMMIGDIIAGIGSTASILYFQDTVTYRDNTTEPLIIKALPCPTATGETKMSMQQGSGLAALKGNEKEEAAALLFTKWITGGETNLNLVTQSGYMPVQDKAFDEIKNYTFKNDSYKSLYDAMDVMRSSYSFYLPPVVDGYYDILWDFYNNSIEVLKTCKERYAAGEGSLESLVAESYRMMESAME
jgi:multiple sugar transport system substrate-binding protein